MCAAGVATWCYGVGHMARSSDMLTCGGGTEQQATVVGVGVRQLQSGCDAVQLQARGAAAAVTVKDCCSSCDCSCCRY